MPDIFVSPRKKGRTDKKAEKLSPVKKLQPNPLAAFMFMPEGVSFETQEPDETIVLLLRKHFITNFPWILTSVILILIPLTIFPVIIANNLIPQFSPTLFQIVSLVWYLFTLSYILVNFLLWYFTISIATNERILDIDFINLLNKKLAETRISRVEDVTQRTGGVFEAFFDYGNVIVQTAGTDPVFQFQSVPKPQEVVRIINQLVEREEET